MFPLETGGLTNALQGLNVKPELISEIVAKLTDTGDNLGQGFEAVQLSPAEFGNRQSATVLGVHYDRAYQVMQATIDGIAADLVDFGTKAKAAAEYVDNADQASAADLAAARASVENLNVIAANSRGDQNYDDARNAPFGAEPTPGPAGEDS